MTISLTAPGALWLLAVIPLIWLARIYGRTNFNPRQQVLQTIVRSLLLAALALALARPVISWGSSRLSVVYLVDVSHSVASAAITGAASRIDELTASVRPDHSRVLVFGTEAKAVENTAALRALADPATAADPAKSPVPREGSDLERALAGARAELRPGHLQRIVLFSDGRETSGDVKRAVTQLAADGIAVFVEPMNVRDLGDTWVDAVQLPVRVSAGGFTLANVVVGSQREVSALVEVLDGTRVLGTKQATVPAGATTVPVEVVFDAEGARAIEARVTVTDDPLATNNTLSREVLVRPRPKVLYVEGSPGSARYLQGALMQAGFDVTVDPASRLPSTLEQLDPWDVVILSDIARTAISQASMNALASWVEDEGGGLLVAGGDSVFGEGAPGDPAGYRNTELERLTPVTFERKDQPEVALIIVFDKSWSMAGQVMELCKAAAQAAIDVLDDEQSVGVVTFNDSLTWDITLRNVGKNREAIRKTMAAIEPSGHTLIYPAVEQAYLALKDAKARAKHVILMSDGRSYPDDYETLLKKMVAAKITVSSISVGPAADAELLGNIAKWGKGRAYVVMDAKEVAQVFVKEAKNATTPSFDEGKTIKPVLKARGFFEGVDFTRMPGLRGRTATVVKDNAVELMATEEGDPLLAFWPIGLGRTAVFASDVKDRWATDWLKWRGYGPFFAALVRAIERQRPPTRAIDVAVGASRAGAQSVTVGLEARDGKGQYLNLLKPVLEITSGDAAPTSVTARQVAPGRYEARVIADASRPLTVTLAGAAGGDAVATSRLVLPDPQIEYRFRDTDTTMLSSIAESSGGKMAPTPEDVRRETGNQQTARRALWPWLVLAAFALWLGDVMLRRIRLFELASA